VAHKKITANDVIAKLESLADPAAAEGMKRHGITPKNAYGVPAPDLRRIAKEAGVDHELAIQLWRTGNREARLVASMVDVPDLVSEQQMEDWVRDFDSWDICDGVCNCLFRKTARAHDKAVEWAKRENEFVKRAGFVLMACLAVHDKKAVNWALRQIGKRNSNLNKAATKLAEEIAQLDSKSARWVASDALRELRSEAVQKRLSRRR
jgi:3-methyladenine DNA glycosylase AlkD